ncbi:hypothetical protein [Krasilnikovia sp. M28-CT-15]|uniref:hypothetical protein n=1 Tax=Krasilnikovia sp. M28-CT-15 TaxID=3373540 RepID=UPI003875FF89
MLIAGRGGASAVTGVAPQASILPAQVSGGAQTLDKVPGPEVAVAAAAGRTTPARPTRQFVTARPRQPSTAVSVFPELGVVVIETSDGVMSPIHWGRTAVSATQQHLRRPRWGTCLEGSM